MNEEFHTTVVRDSYVVYIYIYIYRWSYINARRAEDQQPLETAGQDGFQFYWAHISSGLVHVPHDYLILKEKEKP